MAGMYAAKALVQRLCERFNISDFLHVFILIVYIPYKRKFFVQEVLMHMCLPSFYPNAFLGSTVRLILRFDFNRSPVRNKLPDLFDFRIGDSNTSVCPVC